MADVIKKSRHSRHSRHSKRSKHSKHSSNNSKKQLVTEKQKTKKSYSSLDKRITRKPIRDFEVARVQAILDILPAFTKFYDKLSHNELAAIKYYKGFGSYFQSNLLAVKPAKPAKPAKPDEKKKFYVPFNYGEEISLRRDVFGIVSDTSLYFQPSLDIKEFGKYIDTSYSARIDLLNHLDKIFSRPDCPKMSGQEILFRGMQGNEAIKKLKVGDKYLFQNFISTTIDKKIAERFTGAWGGGHRCVFVLMNMKDIPFIYMPNSKLGDTSIKYSTFMKAKNLFQDLSEYTLPRNLEFTIERIENKPISAHPNNKNGSFATLEKVLRRKGYFNSSSASNANNTDATTDATTDDNIKKEIEKLVFASATHYYCRFNEWKPRMPIDWKTISSNVEFILDRDALESWNTKEDWF